MTAAKKKKSAKSANADKPRASKGGQDLLSTSKEVWAKLEPKLKVAYKEISKQVAYQINDEKSATRRFSKQAYKSAKSTIKLAKAKLKKIQAAKKETVTKKKAPAKKKTPAKK